MMQFHFLLVWTEREIKHSNTKFIEHASLNHTTVVEKNTNATDIGIRHLYHGIILHLFPIGNRESVLPTKCGGTKHANENQKCC